METETEKELETIKVKKPIAKDKIIIGSIVGAMVIIALVVFGIFLYNSNYKIVATFDGGSLNVSDFNIYYQTFYPLLSMYGYDDETARDEIVNKAVLDKIIYNLATENGITLSDEDLAEVEELMNDESQTEYIESLGIDPSQMEELYKSDYIISAYTTYMTESVTEEEMEEYIYSYYGDDMDLSGYITRHVLISTIDSTTYEELSDEDKAIAYEEALDVIARLDDGESIEDLALELSDDTYSAADGGLIEVYMDETLVTEYIDATMELEVGEYTTVPVETDYGYHIIYLESYDERGFLNSETEKSYLVSEKLEDLYDDYNVVLDLDAINQVVFDVTGVEITSTEE